MTTTDDLYPLLPAIYRIRDAERGGSLEALLDVLAGQHEVVRSDIARLLDNWFIETCDPWVVPYVADLLAAPALHGVAAGTASPRAYVANTLAYRRRKGTAAVLEQLAFDVTGWRARVAEYFELVGTTQYAKHVRPQSVRTPDLRDANALDLLGSPFETAPRTGEVRRVASERGRYNIPNLGIHLWRLQAYPVMATRATARRSGSPGQGRFSFHPVGLDAPLFNVPRSEAAIDQLATERDLPAPLRRRALLDELEAGRQAAVEGGTAPAQYFSGNPVLRLFKRDAPPPAPFTEVPPDQILVADLSLWQRPPTSRSYVPRSGGPAHALPVGAAIDPELGRLTFPIGTVPSEVEVRYAYGFSADLGGGPYDRTRFVDQDFVRRVSWQVGVSRGVPPVAGHIFATLGEAVAAWNAQPPGTVGVIAVMDSRTYAENLTGAHRIELKEGSELLVTAAHWPEVDVAGVPTRMVGTFAPRLLRPHLRGAVSVLGTAPGAAKVPGRLTLDGLLLEGDVSVLVGNLGALRLADCTVVPRAGRLIVHPSAAPAGRNALLAVSLERVICGAVMLADAVPAVELSDSVVGAVGAADAVGAAGAAASIQGCTLLGRVDVRQLEASDSIFLGPVVAERLQAGCVRFSFVAADPATRTPRRYRCQPDLALRGIEDPVQRDVVTDRMVPTFKSLTYGRPDYVQLSESCPAEIGVGAEGGSEMGAFRSLRQPQREANLRACLEEYLRVGLEAGLFFVT